MNKKAVQRGSVIFGTLTVLALVGGLFQNCSKSVPADIQAQVGSSTGDTPLNAVASDASVLPGNSAAVIVSLDRDYASDVSFTYSTVDDSAVAGTHYVAANAQTGSIAAGSLTAQVMIATSNTTGVDYTNKDFMVRFDFGAPINASQFAKVSFTSPVVIPSTYQNSANSGELAAGDLHVCGLRKSGGLYCWGYNANGQLGNGNTSNSNVPVLVASMESGVQAVAAGYRFSCAIKADALFCWGLGTSNQLGNGSAASSSFPVAVFNMTSGVQAVSAGNDHACAIKAGALYCWGANGNMQVGLTGGTQAVPYKVPGFETGVTAVAASLSFTCAVKGGALYCWGLNSDGQLGLGNTTNIANRNPTSATLSPVVSMDSGVTAVYAHGPSVCAVKNGSVYCWGKNDYGQLGLGNTASVTAPNLVASLPASSVTHFSNSRTQACAIKNGAVYCWGDNGFFGLGNGTTTDKTAPDATPVAIPYVAGEVAEQVTAGGFNYNNNGNVATTCMRTNKQRVFCWGYNAQGQVGDASTTNRSLPVELPSMAQ